MSAISRAYAGATPSSGVAREWPASFLTGPLGSNNLLPTGPGAFLAANCGGNGYYLPDQDAMYTARESAMGRTYDCRQYHMGGGDTWGSDFGAPDPYAEGDSREERCFDNGAECLIVWTPNYGIAQMNTGSADAIWAKMATHWATFAPNRIMLRMFHELDNGFPWAINGTGGPHTAAAFISAWQRAVNVISAIADNVGYWWCPNEGPQDGRTFLSTCYPGDAWVDWVGSDWYNVITSQSTPIHTGWAEWWELFNYSCAAGGYTGAWSHYDLFGSGDAVSGTRSWTGTPRVKPFMVGENSSKYDTGTPSHKANYWRNVVDHANGIGSMPNCIGVSFYDADVHSASNYNWQVDSNAAVVNVVGSADATTLAGFVEMAGDPAFEGR